MLKNFSKILKNSQKFLKNFSKIAQKMKKKNFAYNRPEIFFFEIVFWETEVILRKQIWPPKSTDQQIPGSRVGPQIFV